MSFNAIEQVDTLTFDIFGTVLDLTTNIVPTVRERLQAKGAATSPDAFWAQWRARQRIEQYQDTILMLGHSGYLEVARRALIYTLRHNGIAFDDAETHDWLHVFERLRPYNDALEGRSIFSAQEPAASGARTSTAIVCPTRNRNFDPIT